MRLLPIIFLFFTPLSFACNLTEKYKELRSTLYKEVHESYYSCRESTSSYFYYLAVAKCIEEGRGEGISGGCFHVAGYEGNFRESDLAHCEVLKPKLENFKVYLKEQAKEKDIDKCLK